jgi:hypothetical protein
MKVRYVGVFADEGVELHEREGGIWFPGHEAVDVGEDLARRLLEQKVNFEPADEDATTLLASLEASELDEEPEPPEDGDHAPPDDAAGITTPEAPHRRRARKPADKEETR